MNIARTFQKLAAFLPALCIAAPVPLDLSGVKPGPVAVTRVGDVAVVRWPDGQNRAWEAHFNLEPTRPLIASIQVNGKAVVQNAVPLYNCQVGKRRGGFDEFFDFPPSHSEGTRSFIGRLQPTAARAVTNGDRVEISFDGFQMGSFSGSVRYLFYPGSRLIQQAAVASTNDPDVAYFYDAGLRMAVPRDARPGNNMESEVTYYDTEGKIRVEHPNTSERLPVQVRYRTLAARAQGGSLAVFPTPHKYFMPRDFTTNMGFLWHTSFRGQVSVGIRQLPDDNSRFYPWMNAPPGTEQRMNVFFLVSDGEARPLLDEVTRYTNKDRFPKLDGYLTMAPHWHLAYTVQAMEKGATWVPPFKPVLQDMGVDVAMIADFHGDGHPQDMTELRLKELKAYYDFCKAQSDSKFLLIPSEEANVHYGGHWAVAFPKPVYWFMAKPDAKSSVSEVPGYGKVYTISSSKALLDMMRREHGFAYQTHPRTKGSKTFPDDIRYTEHFLDDTYWGAGWKQMPADMASPRLGERSLTLLDDMSNWGLKKRLLAEVDVFQIDSTHELYAHMNINYVRAKSLPSFDQYGELLQTMERGDFFMSTGEVLLPEHSIRGTQNGKLVASADVRYTLPLQFAELVWGDGEKTHRKIYPLDTTREFGNQKITFDADAPGWRWARLAVWDVAGNGAFANPVRNTATRKIVAVDAWHNRESEPHYAWEGTYQGGFSGLSHLLQGLGAETRTIKEAMTAKSLQGVDCLIIVDPDTPKEAANPNMITDAEIDALTAWVRNGGTLLLLGNDPGNAEFPRLNALAAKFGLSFEERKHADAQGSTKLTLETTSGGWFTPGLKFYGVDLAPLKVSNPKASALLTEKETVMMAAVPEGKGQVIALGDPWIYNEYLYTQNNRRLAE
ncbi:MAG TPA: DUF4350 domain-containing protein, partial [Bryobacteraceae bacterium]|nr:DUF4350 domain-containing protein [Bryobacteraceae bacterium]